MQKTGLLEGSEKYANKDNNQKYKEIILNFIDDTEKLFANKSELNEKKFLKKRNSIISSLKKVDNAVICGKMNNTVKNDLCCRYQQAKTMLGLR